MALCEHCQKIFGLSEEKLREFLQQFEAGSSQLEENSAEDDMTEQALSPVHDAECSECSNEDIKSPPTEEIKSPPTEDMEPASKKVKLEFPSPNGSLDHEHGSHDLPKCCPEVQCVACLGVLEQQYLKHVGDVITEHVHKVGVVGIETYSLSIHVPLSLSIRRVGMEKCIKKCIADHCACVSENGYVKEELKMRLKQILDSSLAPLRYSYNSHFTIILELDNRSSLRDCIGLKKLHPKLFPRPKKRRNSRKNLPTPFTSANVQKALENITEADLVKESYFLSTNSTPCTHVVKLEHRSIFVAGRYNKYSRKLPQTPWLVDGVRKADTSVQELFCPQIMSAFKAADVRFSSSGREDVDVRMLGNGRPFLLELVNPMNVSIGNAQLTKMEEDINSRTDFIAVKQLKKVGKESSNLLKVGEEHKKKTYLAVVRTEEEVTGETLIMLEEKKELVIRQKTPIRVLHRRTLTVREKTIHSMKTELLDPHHFRLTLVTQAGTYIKEFVHGDFGRTQPNVGTLLGCDADILSLDVEDVQLQWPPVE